MTKMMMGVRAGLVLLAAVAAAEANHFPTDNLPPVAGVAMPTYAPGSVFGYNGTAIAPAPAATFRPVHPYHLGEFKVPPVSAYSAVRVMPPAYYGFPSYYYPAAYLAPNYGVQLPVTYPYQYAPMGRAGAYYMSVYGGGAAYPH